MISRWLLAGMLALAACTDTREIVLSIDSSAGVPCDIDRIRIVGKASETTTIERSLDGVRLPISVTLLDSTSNGDFTLEISGLKGNSEVMRAIGPLQFSGHKVTETVVLDPKCTPDTPCRLSDVGSATGAREQCGPNVTRYRAEPTVQKLVDACTAAAMFSGVALMDGSRVPVRLMDLEKFLPGFGFQFYGRPVRQIWVSKDGYISFAQNNPDPGDILIPGPLDLDLKHLGEPPPQQSVMAFWDSLTLPSSGVCYALEGQGTNQQLHVTWKHACLVQPCDLADRVNNLNFTITLDANTQQIVLTYGTEMDGTMVAGAMDRAKGATATVGLANDTTGCPVEECVLATGLCKDGVTPCGYSQVFSNTIQPSGVQNIQFTPIVGP